MKQRAAIKFCFKCGKSASYTITMLERVYSDDCPSKSIVYEWYKRCYDAQESLEDVRRIGCPCTTINDNNVQSIRTF